MRLSHYWGSRGTITEKYILARFLLPAIWVVSIVCRFGLLTIYCLGYFGKRGIVFSLIVMGGRWKKFFVGEPKEKKKKKREKKAEKALLNTTSIMAIYYGCLPSGSSITLFY